MSGRVKIEINESEETLKQLLKNASTPQEKERIQTIYWLKTKTVETVKQIAIMLGRNRVTVQKWLHKYRTGGMNLLLERKKNLGGRPTSIPTDVIEKLKEELQKPARFQSYGEIQLWLKTCFDINVAYRTVHQLVRYKLKSKLKVPRPLHIKQNKESKETLKKNSHT
ncbi:MAG: helix-turn-helix domain-containing protein [Xenococcaceae cyanobacterium MO_207.B15]|nr:helix-turn-helix domain-containing protein [Xenococcaceae cyanobacterium MO_207.B15]